MGNSYSSHERQKTKCFPTAKKLPETFPKAETNPKSCTSGGINASDVYIPHRASNSVGTSGSCVKKIKGRYWFQRITKASSYHSEGRLCQSENATLTEQFDKSALLTTRRVSTSDTKSPQSLDLTISFDLERPVFAPVPEEKTSDGSLKLSSSMALSDNQNGTPKRLSSLASNGTFPLRHRSESSASRSQYRRSHTNKLSASPSLNSAVATETPMTCTLLHYPSANGNNKVFPFLPEGAAYLLSDEQHRSVERTLCGTKLLLHRLKRVLIENSGHLQSIADQADNRSPISAPIHDTGVPQSAPLTVFDANTLYTTSRFSFDFSQEPTNLNDALREIQRLREDNMRLMEELAKRDAFIQHSLQTTVC
ncbi:unnamed protein product [Hymenolepis diminuta]|uniref:Uncharacterized protein n=1 Tax=Hymenolepis diminuta TaxID=6216 RepID=A0A564YXW5_HYMDI|nr:unnamed protein product [Hymenolepis diminuta]